MTDISDHYPCITSISLNRKIKTEPYTFTSRKLNENNVQKIKNDLNKVNWNILNNLDAQNGYNEFEDILIGIIDEHASTKTRKCKYDNIIREPWMTQGMMYSSKKLNKLYLKK
jgi:hypothetical protein